MATFSCFGGSQIHESERKRSIHELSTLVSSYDKSKKGMQDEAYYI